MSHAPESEKAFGELLDLLKRIPEEYIVPERRAVDSTSAADGFRYALHTLQAALFTHAEADPDRPAFKRIVSPTRKMNGDNADAIYFESEISPGHAYLVKGNLAGAVYTSFTIEAGAGGGAYAERTSGIINDTHFDVGTDGSYEIRLGGEEQERNWIPLDPEACRISSRHYFEHVTPAASNPDLLVPLSIEAVDSVGPPPSWDDAKVAESIRRATTFVAGRTVDQPPRGETSPSWVSEVPNEFPTPESPGDMAYAAIDAAYSMAPYMIGPDEALVMTSRWPKCRFGNVNLWNFFTQSYDFSNRSIARNRANTVPEPDGSFHIIVAHEDPGVGNWLDSEGRGAGMVFWRYFLPEGEMHPIDSAVVKVSELR
jgi:hypothetical protein